MGISVSPSAIGTQSYPAPKVHTKEELEQLKKEPTQLAIEGNIYQARNIHNRKLSQEELQKESITVDTSAFERVYHSDGSRSRTNRIVALRDGNGEVITLQLSQKTLARLQAKFDGSNNFFERGDGVLRLNGEAEDFVTGWLEDIRKARNYEKADADGNGRIEGDERKELRIGFERNGDYDYLGKKLVEVNLGTGDTYRKLGDTPDAAHLFYTDEEREQYEKMGYEHKRTALGLQYDRFETSVEKELEHTLMMDRDLDGTVTLEEKMIDEYGGKNYRTAILRNVQGQHDRMLEERPELNDESRVQHKELFSPEILDDEEKKALIEAFRKEAKATSEYFKNRLASGPFYLGGFQVESPQDTQDDASEKASSTPPSVSSITRFDILDFEYRQTEAAANNTTVTAEEVRMTYTAATTYFGNADATAKAGAQKGAEALPELFAKAAFGIDLKI